jgi:hypothetical protein
MGRMRITGSDPVLAVHDLDRSARWFRDVLGAELSDPDSGNWRFCRAGEVTFMLGRCPDVVPASELGDHSYVAYLNVDDLAARRRARRPRRRVQPRDAASGARGSGGGRGRLPARRRARAPRRRVQARGATHRARGSGGRQSRLAARCRLARISKSQHSFATRSANTSQNALSRGDVPLVVLSRYPRLVVQCSVVALGKAEHVLTLCLSAERSCGVGRR